MCDVRAILANDTKHRVVGVEGDLYPLGALTLESWDYSSPTLATGRTVGGEDDDNDVSIVDVDDYKEISLCGPEKFQELFYKSYPFLADVPLDGLLIAGSSVGQFIRLKRGRPTWSASDVDVFFHGHETPALAQARLVRFIGDLKASIQRRLRAGVQKKIETELAAAKEEYKGSESMRKSMPFEVEKRRQRRDYLAAIATFAEGSYELIPGSMDRYGDRETAFYQPVGLSSAPVPVGITESEWRSLCEKTKYKMPTVDTLRTEGSLTLSIEFEGSTVKIQLVFRHYKTKSEILHGFDMGAAAVGFDGATVLFTGLGQFSYEYGVNLVDVSRRSPTFEGRLAKYMTRGFRVVLPGLDMEAMRAAEGIKYGIACVAPLPFMPFTYTALDDNRIVFGRFLNDYGSASDYGPDGELLDAGWENEYRVAYLNLYTLVNGRKNFIHSKTAGSFDDAIDVLSKAPHLTVEMVQRLYDKFREAVWRKGRLNVNLIVKYLPKSDTGKLAFELARDAKKGKALLNEVFGAHRKEAIRLWKSNIEAVDHSKIPWITENPGGQGLLTGSRTPIATTPEAWYGTLYAKE